MALADRKKAVPAGLIALALLACAAGRTHAGVEADVPFRLRAELGLGANRTPGIAAPSAAGAGFVLAVGPRWMGATTPVLELAAIAGGQPPGTVSPLGGARPGGREYYAGTVGLERSFLRSRSMFGAMGFGLGYFQRAGSRPSLNDALSDPANSDEPDRSGMALAGSAGFGWRHGSGPVHFQWALRGHALVDAGEAPFASYLLTAGVAF